MTLDMRPLSEVIARLVEGLAAYGSDPIQHLIRDGLRQRFKVTYEGLG